MVRRALLPALIAATVPATLTGPSAATAPPADPDRSWRPEELVACILGTEPPFPAGDGWEYSAGPGNPFGGTDAMISEGKFAINPQFEWAGGGYATSAS